MRWLQRDEGRRRVIDLVAQLAVLGIANGSGMHDGPS
jgi:hypothetical protein